MVLVLVACHGALWSDVGNCAAGRMGVLVFAGARVAVVSGMLGAGCGYVPRVVEWHTCRGDVDAMEPHVTVMWRRGHASWWRCGHNSHALW